MKIDPRNGGVRFAVHVQPRASSTELAGNRGDAVKVRLQAPPVDGAAIDVDDVQYLLAVDQCLELVVHLRILSLPGGPVRCSPAPCLSQYDKP